MDKLINDVIQAFGYDGAIDNNHKEYGKAIGQYKQLLLGVNLNEFDSAYIGFYELNRYFRNQTPQVFGKGFRKYNLSFVWINRILYIIKDGNIKKEIELIN